MIGNLEIIKFIVFVPDIVINKKNIQVTFSLKGTGLIETYYLIITL